MSRLHSSRLLLLAKVLLFALIVFSCNVLSPSQTGNMQATAECQSLSSCSIHRRTQRIYTRW
ncbi:hypothetical protein PoMZ_10524 [Pyricularia oryzae]|uniref:Uncharacterized protein n=1 Tax=Pyricularia oryzae TaxID=318829 RepID=A0A4P7N4D9_PYROR|nr:hypothetical protein PoMZ_10524 [Pyricularia oryzae]